MQKSERRAQILRHAKEVFARKGYHATGVSDIIDQAGIARGTLYLYFSGKREVYGALLDTLLEELEGAIRPVELGEGHPEPLLQLRDNVRRVLELLVRDPANTRLFLHQAAALDRPSRETIRRFYEHVLGMIHRALRHGLRLGIARPCDRRIVGACILGMVKEVVERLSGRRPSAGALDAAAGEIVRFGLGGIAKRP